MAANRQFADIEADITANHGGPQYINADYPSELKNLLREYVIFPTRHGCLSSDYMEVVALRMNSRDSILWLTILMLPTQNIEVL